ncbi:PAS domain-containing protein [Bdellovibrio sp. HCB209]|uniref:PAS domain-containing protein n=1 Tax=Bdellovibrio sp. HCB209 TaxID=3394354 RepID=UPI0039B47987
MIPILACCGIATCYLSTMESAKAERVYKRAVSRLAETESSHITLDRFFAISSDLMAVAGQDGLLKKVSTSLINTLGYNEETLLNTPFFEFIHPDDKESTKKNIEALNQGLRSVGFENRYRAADGNYRTLSWSAAADKQLGVRFASARDVTEERAFQSRTQQIMDAVPFLLLIKDLNGTILNCNTAFSKSIGVPRPSLIGRNTQQFLSFEAIFSDLEKEQEILKSKSSITYEESLNPKEETKYLSTIFPISDPTGRVVSIGKVSLKIETTKAKTTEPTETTEA